MVCRVGFEIKHVTSEGGERGAGISEWPGGRFQGRRGARGAGDSRTGYLRCLGAAAGIGAGGHWSGFVFGGMVLNKNMSLYEVGIF